MILTSLTRYRDIGLLILRVGLGAMFIVHGWPKISGGAEKWEQLGGAMANFGITFAPAFWGFMAAVAEFFGGILVILGFFFRPACFLLVINLLVAVVMHMSKGDGFGGWSHAAEDGIVFLALILIGPGIYSLDSLFTGEGRRDPERLY